MAEQAAAAAAAATSQLPLTLIVRLATTHSARWIMERSFQLLMFQNHQPKPHCQLEILIASSSKWKQLNGFDTRVHCVSGWHYFVLFAFETKLQMLLRNKKKVSKTQSFHRVEGKTARAGCVCMSASENVLWIASNCWALANCSNYLNNCASMRMPCMNNSKANE